MKNQAYHIISALTLIGLLLTSGCAGEGKALREQMANTEKSVVSARDLYAAINAPLELKLANDKLRAAKAATDRGEYDRARNLLEEARVDIDLAKAKAGSARAQQSRDSIKALLKEIEKGQKSQEIYYY